MIFRAIQISAAIAALSQGLLEADTFLVTNTADDGPGSLRQAILDANAHPNASQNLRDEIHFAIVGVDIQRIAPFPYELPEITDPVVIDGFTQPGAVANTNPVGQGLNTVFKIELDGNEVVSEADGLLITCGNSTVRGLIINRFYHGITCRGGSGNAIEGNFIGTDRTGTFAPFVENPGREVQQSYNVVIEECSNTRIGGQVPAARNLIAGGYYADARIRGSGAIGNVVEGNLIGTKASGMEFLEFGGATGVNLQEGASGNLVGGTVVAARNVISSSNWVGGYYGGVVFYSGFDGTKPPFGNFVKGNFIGLNVTGTGTVDTEEGATGIGILLAGHDNIIGGIEPGARNVISGNHVSGIFIGGDGSSEATKNSIQGNFIGTDESGAFPIGNGRSGISIRVYAHDNMIGGTQPGAGNRIAFAYNHKFPSPAVGAGITAVDFAPDYTLRNSILGNSIYGNHALGIDLNADLSTPNDLGDADLGSNNLQNYPVLGSASFSGNLVTIQGTLQSAGDLVYRVEFFGDNVADSLGAGEGKAFLGGTNVGTDSGGNATFNFSWPCPAGIRVVTATATDPDGNTSEFSQAISISGTPPGQLVNISTRLGVQSGDEALIGGFIITGIDPKRVLVRGIGPSLSSVAGALSDPTLELFHNGSLFATNDNWRESQQAEIEDTGIPPSNDLESAIVWTLAPGAYTAVMRGHDNTTGIGVVEVYDLDQGVVSQLANISTRGVVQTGENVMIGGLICQPAGGGSARVVVRAIGPSLHNFGIVGELNDPTLQLLNSDGGVIRSNNDWRESQEAEIIAAGLEPSDNRESALIETIAPGSYTAIVRGTGDASGVALVEVYQIQ